MSSFLLNKRKVFHINFLCFLFLFLGGKNHQKELLFGVLLYIKNSSCIWNFNTLSRCILGRLFHSKQSEPFWFCPAPFNVKTMKAVPAHRSLLQTALLMLHVIYHMAYSCSLSYCSHLTSSSGLSVHPDFRQTLLECPSSCFPYLPFPMPYISQMFRAYSCLVENTI